MTTVAERVLFIVEAHLPSSPPATLTDRFVDDLEADSLDTIEIALAIEEAFSVEISDEAYNFTTAGDIVDWLNQQGITDGDKS